MEKLEKNILIVSKPGESIKASSKIFTVCRHTDKRQLLFFLQLMQTQNSQGQRASPSEVMPYFAHCMLKLEQNLLPIRDANTTTQDMYICTGLQT